MSLSPDLALSEELREVLRLVTFLKNHHKFANRPEQQLLLMIEENLKFETQRASLKLLFQGLEVCKNAMGCLFILSGCLDVSNIKSAIQQYLENSKQVAQSCPRSLIAKDALCAGNRNKLWAITDDERWRLVQNDLIMLADPLVQSRIIKQSVSGVETLIQVNESLLQYDLLKSNQSILNQSNLEQLIKGLGVSLQKSPAFLALAHEKSWISLPHPTPALIGTVAEQEPTASPALSLSPVLCRQSFKGIFKLQSLCSEPLLLEKEMGDKYWQLADECTHARKIKWTDFKTSPLRYELCKVVFGVYDFRAKWNRGAAAWFTLGISHAGWSDYDLYKLRFFYAKWVDAFKNIIPEISLSKDSSIQNQQDAMIDGILVAFLERMITELNYYKEAKYLYAEVMSGKFNPIKVLMNPLVQVNHEYRLAPHLELCQKNQNSQEQVALLTRERDDLSKQLEVKSKESQNLKNEHGILKDENGILKDKNKILNQNIDTTDKIINDLTNQVKSMKSEEKTPLSSRGNKTSDATCEPNAPKKSSQASSKNLPSVAVHGIWSKV